MAEWGGDWARGAGCQPAEEEWQVGNLPHGPAVPLVEELTPAPGAWEVCRKLADRPRLLFLDSALEHPELGRYSFVLADPFVWLRARGRRVWCNGAERDADPWRVLAELLGSWKAEHLPGLPP